MSYKIIELNDHKRIYIGEQENGTAYLYIEQDNPYRMTGANMTIKECVDLLEGLLKLLEDIEHKEFLVYNPPSPRMFELCRVNANIESTSATLVTTNEDEAALEKVAKNLNQLDDIYMYFVRPYYE